MITERSKLTAQDLNGATNNFIKMNKKSFLLAAATSTALLFSSCSKDEDISSQEQQNAELEVLANGFGIANSSNRYYVVNPESVSSFNISNIKELVNNGNAIELTDEMFAKMKNRTSDVEVLL